MYPIATLAATAALLLTVPGCTTDRVQAAPATVAPSSSSTPASSASASRGPASRTPATQAPAGSTSAGPVGSSPAARTAPGTSAPQSAAGPAAPARRTQQIVRRPVTAQGRVAAGYTLVADPPQSRSSCGYSRFGGAFESPVAVDAGPVSCGASAEYALACWNGPTATTALCYRDPWQRQVARINTGGRMRVLPPPAQPSPLGLVLDNGVRCKLRDGGAWSRLDGHPEMYGTYYCDGTEVVWGAERSDGIDRRSPLWQVWLAPGSGHGKLHPMTVRTAYFVGTARS